ncbi:MAG TPA: SDR family NAD(P)-dependent oxidoreductase [Candidatus Baltobacteraceae bacterium]|jgi:NAD(P)-dependent dehydrogenase (short-subunit alcohol dehydrogenase family)
MIAQPSTSPFLADLLGLDGKVAIVTGAGSGIGHGIARYFARAGADVVIADRDAAAGRRVAEELVAAGRRSMSIETDVSDEASVGAMMRSAIERFGHVDILVNDAGIFPAKLIADMTLAEWERVQGVNLRGTFLCLREAALHMRARGEGGRIINISSIDSLHPSMAGLAHYDASKGGVNMLTRSAALEFGGDKITVNAVLPGMIATEGAAAASKDLAAAASEVFGKRTVLGRVGTPEDVAGCVLFLASKAAGYVTGQTLVVDGGFLIG